MILSNQARCRVCGDTPYSTHRHHYSECECGAIAVDGGMDYIRRVGDPKDYEDMSIVVSNEDFEGLLEAVSDEARNELGHLCNIARYLRDNMNINIGD
jgi:hypothetical protein